MPFSPVNTPDVTYFFPWFYQSLQSTGSTNAGGQTAAGTAASDAAMNWMNDFSVSVSKTTPLFLNQLILIVWLIADFTTKDMRYILLHELQHARHKDALANYLITLMGIVYWFNPLVWYGLREMRNDREIVCDSSVLQLFRRKRLWRLWEHTY